VRHQVERSWILRLTSELNGSFLGKMADLENGNKPQSKRGRPKKASVTDDGSMPVDVKPTKKTSKKAQPAEVLDTEVKQEVAEPNGRHRSLSPEAKEKSVSPVKKSKKNNPTAEQNNARHPSSSPDEAKEKSVSPVKKGKKNNPAPVPVNEDNGDNDDNMAAEELHKLSKKLVNDVTKILTIYTHKVDKILGIDDH